MLSPESKPFEETSKLIKIPKVNGIYGPMHSIEGAYEIQKECDGRTALRRALMGMGPDDERGEVRASLRKAAQLSNPVDFLMVRKQLSPQEEVNLFTEVILKQDPPRARGLGSLHDTLRDVLRHASTPHGLPFET